MKRILYIIGIMIVTAFGCAEIEFEINEEYEQAEIIGVELYGRGMIRADKTTEISSEEGAILVILKPRKEITDLKVAVTASTGVSINPSMSVGYQDFSSPKTYEVTSPNKTIKKNWTITVQNPE
jgi:DNA polymerase II small subunit/DNA polymerase delta subunit B